MANDITIIVTLAITVLIILPLIIYLLSRIYMRRRGLIRPTHSSWPGSTHLRKLRLGTRAADDVDLEAGHGGRPARGDNDMKQAVLGQERSVKQGSMGMAHVGAAGVGVGGKKHPFMKHVEGKTTYGEDGKLRRLTWEEQLDWKKANGR
ncbi:hypothetical protein BDV95DRAFT_608001 [Massariosphaeria phaeospora]|uniref:Uncharacterized protein n=1 Tax=Massariosphaeria phaeospora TaxID=100035 RepID=A0A7C8I700_9PLEO|nr:hypothetical protein BDV95DRAFT_608001 [Massariosphaeria phaeospora]